MTTRAIAFDRRMMLAHCVSCNHVCMAFAAECPRRPRQKSLKLRRVRRMARTTGTLGKRRMDNRVARVRNHRLVTRPAQLVFAVS